MMGPTNDLNVSVIDHFASKIQSGDMPDFVEQMIQKPLVINFVGFEDALESIGTAQVQLHYSLRTIFNDNILVVQI